MKKLVLVFLLFCSFVNAQSLVELRGYLQKGENSEEVKPLFQNLKMLMIQLKSLFIWYFMR